MEITLKNAPSDKPDNSLYIALLSAAAAIVGGYLAARYSHKQAMAVEKLRYEKEEKKQDEIEAKQQKQKEEYREKVTALTYQELMVFSKDLKTLEEKEYLQEVDEYYHLKIMQSSFETYKMEFLNIPYDIRLTLFTPDVLYVVQTAYETFQAFIRVISPTIQQQMLEHENGRPIVFNRTLKKIQPSGVGYYVDKAIKELENILPKSVIEKIK